MNAPLKVDVTITKTPFLRAGRGATKSMIIVVVALILIVILLLIPLVERWERQQRTRRHDRMKQVVMECTSAADSDGDET